MTIPVDSSLGQSSPLECHRYSFAVHTRLIKHTQESRQLIASLNITPIIGFVC